MAIVASQDPATPARLQECEAGCQQPMEPIDAIGRAIGILRRSLRDGQTVELGPAPRVRHRSVELIGRVIRQVEIGFAHART